MSLAAASRSPSRHDRPEHGFARSGEQTRPRPPGAHPPAILLRKQRIVLGHGFVCFVGRGSIDDRQLPRSFQWLAFMRSETSATLSAGTVSRDSDFCASNLLIVASRADCARTFGSSLPSGRWYLPVSLRAIAAAIRDGKDRPGRALYVRAKGLELLCETVAHLRAAALTPCCGTGDLSEIEARRIMAARELIESRFQEALSLNDIARMCGLNRTNLTRGFRQLNGISVGAFIRTVRMKHARALLLTTDLPVATVGYRCGYRSDASFARAFARHYAVSPTTMRASLVGATSR